MIRLLLRATAYGLSATALVLTAVVILMEPVTIQETNAFVRVGEVLAIGVAIVGLGTMLRESGVAK